MPAEILIQPAHRLLGSPAGDIGLFGGQPDPGIIVTSHPLPATIAPPQPFTTTDSSPSPLHAPALALADAVPLGTLVSSQPPLAQGAAQMPAAPIAFAATSPLADPSANPVPASDFATPAALPTQQIRDAAPPATHDTDAPMDVAPATAALGSHAAMLPAFAPPTLDGLHGAIDDVRAQVAGIEALIPPATPPLAAAASIGVDDLLAGIDGASPIAPLVPDVPQVPDKLIAALDAAPATVLSAVTPHHPALDSGIAKDLVQAATKAVSDLDAGHLLPEAAQTPLAPETIVAAPLAAATSTVAAVTGHHAPKIEATAEHLVQTVTHADPPGETGDLLTGMAGSDPVGGVTTLVQLMKTADIFELHQSSTHPIEHAAPAIDTLAFDAAEVSPLLGDHDLPHASLLGGGDDIDHHLLGGL